MTGASESGPRVSLDAVSVTYTSGPPWARKSLDAMQSVSLTVEAGETLGLVGESGSGKSTTGKVCLGLVRPTSGRVEFDGQPFPKRRGELRGRIGAVLQHPQWSLNPRLRVGTSIGEPLTILSSMSRAERRRKVSESLELVGLEASFGHRLPHELSGGQRQRVAIARALITNPSLIVFDEAVSALDVSVQTQILNLMKKVQEEYKFAALFISHDLAAVRYVAHRVAVMRLGEIVETASAAAFYEQPKHAYSRSLLAAFS